MQQLMTTQKDGTKNKAEIEISGVKERSEVLVYYLQLRVLNVAFRSVS